MPVSLTTPILMESTINPFSKYYLDMESTLQTAGMFTGRSNLTEVFGPMWPIPVLADSALLAASFPGAHRRVEPATLRRIEKSPQLFGRAAQVVVLMTPRAYQSERVQNGLRCQAEAEGYLPLAP